MNTRELRELTRELIDAVDVLAAARATERKAQAGIIMAFSSAGRDSAELVLSAQRTVLNAAAAWRDAHK